MLGFLGLQHVHAFVVDIRGMVNDIDTVADTHLH